jgi:sulfur carrier protein ThiS
LLFTHQSKTSASKYISSQSEGEETSFVEFRRKVQAAEMLSSAMERLLQQLRFTGRLSVVVQNGRVLKSGYEEGYFRQPTVS